MAGSPPQGYPQQPPPAVPNASAPYGVHPKTGMPYSDKQKVLVGILQLLPVIALVGGVGRLVAGHVGIGIAQLLLSFVCIGGIWSIIDGIIILVSDDATDGQGRPLRPN